MYYPISKITPDQYTSGNEFIIASTGEKYTGYYYSAYDGKFFSGRTPSSESLELSRTSSSDRTLSSIYTSVFHLPSPTSTDYQRGFMTRYFTNRVNGTPDTILEVTFDNYNAANPQVLYNTTQLDWKISGQLYDDFSNVNMPVYGVVDTNKRVLKLKEKEMPGISKYLHNLTQFYADQV